MSHPVHALLSDISPTGCYVKTEAPLPAGSVVDIRITVDDEEIVARGLARTTHPGVGNGIEFTQMTATARRQLEAYVAKLREKDTPTSVRTLGPRRK